MKKYFALALACNLAYADELQYHLMYIASEEAAIANIGANKTMMLYGTSNPLPIINRWNTIQNRPALSKEQISAINELEQDKMTILKQAANEK